ncbi:aspartic peptidase domain-containing protein [Halenospora varia]|nr:aspartic peptidase domain-containing protein [Halenospora varia]
MTFSTSFFLSLGLALTANAAPTAGAACPQPYDMPLIRDPSYGYLGNISVGTPPQPLTVFTDWTWTSQYVVSTTCAGNTTNTAACLSPQQQIFNQSKSSTYKNESSLYPSESWFPNEFFPAPFMVDYGSDVQAIGPVSSRVVIQTSNIETGLFTQLALPFGGIFGLMPPTKGGNASDESPFYQQWLSKQWPAPYTAFSFCPNPTCPPGADAIQTFGGYSSSLAKKGLSWYPIVAVPEVNDIDFTFSPGVYSYWSIGLQNIFIGNERQSLNVTAQSVGDGVPAAIFDHASKGRGLPLSQNAYQRLVKSVGAQAIPSTSAVLTPYPPNNGPQSFYSVDCSKISSLPVVSYQFNGSPKLWKVQPADYVLNIQGTCVLNVRTVGSGDYLLGNFGETFLKGKYIVFDFKKGRVGLAEV